MNPDLTDLTVLGATGRVGRLVVRAALARGLRVSALVRDPARLAADTAGRLPVGQEPRLRVVRGELDDADAVRSAVAGSRAVVVTAGLRYRGGHPWSGVAGRPDVVPAAVRAVLGAADPRQHVVLLSAVGAGDSWRALPAVVRAIVSTSALRTSYAGLTEGERLLRESGQRHTVVRAVTLTDGPAAGRSVDATGRALRGNPKVSREDVAALLLATALDGAGGQVLVAAN